MARIFEEFFEATGYDETGWSEVVPGTCVVDEDEASSAAGSPPLWGAQCLEVTGDGGGLDCYTYNIFGDGAVRFAAVDFKLSALGFDVDGQSITTAYFLNAALAANCGLVLILRVAGVNRIRCYVYHDATAHIISDDVFTLNKLYRFELKWDDTANTWEVWLDNASRGSGSLTGAAATTQMGTVLLGDVQNSVRTFTCRYDRVEVDNASRIGGWAENVTGTASPTEAADAPSASGVIVNIGAGAPAEAADSASAAGTITVSGSAAPQEAADTTNASGLAIVAGGAAVGEQNDVASGSGTLSVVGAAAPLENNDGSAAAGLIQVLGSASVAESGDIAAASGFVSGAFAPSPAERILVPALEIRALVIDHEVRTLVPELEIRQLKAT